MLIVGHVEVKFAILEHFTLFLAIKILKIRLIS